MGNAMKIDTQLPRHQAEALLANLREQYRHTLNELWYADEYRYVPDEDRHNKILATTPVMAAQKRLIGAISHSLKAVK